MVLNAVPKTLRSYGPWKTPATLSSNALDTRPLGAFSGTSYAGNVFTFAGDAAKLYRYSAGAFSDVSDAGGYSIASVYADAVSRAWSFTQFNNICLASNYSDAIQAWTMGTSSVFADLASSAPKGKYLASVGNFLVVANTDDAFDGAIPLRLWWSPIGSPATNDWGNTNLQSDFRTLPSGRQITGITGGEYGVIFCEKSIYRMTYAGPPAIFSIDEIEPDRGCIAPGSIAQKGEIRFYLAEDGFQMMQGIQSIPIGAQKIDATFFEDLDASNVNRIISVIDSVRKLYLVAYPGSGSTSGRPNKILAYNYEIGRWSPIEQQLDFIASLSDEALTVEALGAIYSTVEDIPGSIDSPAFSGGTNYLAMFGTDKMLADFSGINAAMTLDTTRQNLIPGRKAKVRNLRAMIDSEAATVNIGTQDFPDTDPVFGTPETRNSITGLYGFRRKGRYHLARTETAAGDPWTECYGVADIEFVDAGK
jgi:hypothetical protein